jgi:hypothetical protein
MGMGSMLKVGAGIHGDGIDAESGCRYSWRWDRRWHCIIIKAHGLRPLSIPGYRVVIGLALLRTYKYITHATLMSDLVMAEAFHKLEASSISDHQLVSSRPGHPGS